MLFAAAVGLTANHASAADLGRRVPPPAPVYAPPVQYLWTGCYVGGNVGGAWANIDMTNVATGGSVSGSQIARFQPQID